MKTKKKILLCGMVLVFACFVVSDVTGEDETEEMKSQIELKEVPREIISFIKDSWGFVTDEKVLEIEKVMEGERIYYEVEFEGENSGEEISIKASEQGVPIEIEKQMEITKIPKDVMNAVKASYPGINIKEAEIIFNVLYEVEGSVNGKVCEIKMEGTGKILATECEG